MAGLITGQAIRAAVAFLHLSAAPPGSARRKTGEPMSKASKLYRREQLRILFEELWGQAREEAEWHRIQTVNDPAYRALRNDPEWRALEQEYAAGMGKFGERLRRFAARFRDELSADEQAEADKVHAEREAFLCRVRQRAWALMQDYGLPRGIEQAAPRPGDAEPDAQANTKPSGVAQPGQGKAEASHSADFTFVNWYGTEYTFALGVQSSAVKALWGEWEKTGLGLHQDTIRNAVDPERDSFRMDKAFRNHPAFGTMIQNTGDGKYKLAAPATGKAPDPKAKKSAGIPAKSRRRPR